MQVFLQPPYVATICTKYIIMVVLMIEQSPGFVREEDAIPLR